MPARDAYSSIEPSRSRHHICRPDLFQILLCNVLSDQVSYFLLCNVLSDQVSYFEQQKCIMLVICLDDTFLSVMLLECDHPVPCNDGSVAKSFGDVWTPCAQACVK